MRDNNIALKRKGETEGGRVTDLEKMASELTRKLNDANNTIKYRDEAIKGLHEVNDMFQK
jgi:hypothetical protein